MAMRVYELSKKLGIPNKELLELLKEHGFSLSNVAAVPEDAIVLIEKIVNQRTPGKESKTEQQNPVAKEPAKKLMPQETKEVKQQPSAAPVQEKPKETAPEKPVQMAPKAMPHSTFAQAPLAPKAVKAASEKPAVKPQGAEAASGR